MLTYLFLSGSHCMPVPQTKRTLPAENTKWLQNITEDFADAEAIKKEKREKKKQKVDVSFICLQSFFVFVFA